MSLAAAFARLSPLRDDVTHGTYVVEAAQSRPDTYVACSSDGRPALFVSVAQGSDSPGIRLHNLDLRHRTRGDLRTADGSSISGTYTLVECLSHDARLHQAFLDLATEVFAHNTRWRTTNDLERAFSSLVELFKVASSPSTSSWLGTWGELFLMHNSTQPESLLTCWHTDPLKLHDFALGRDRLECKTASGQARIHEFSLSQLDESERTVFVASIVTHESLGGVSALTLYDEIRRRVTRPELRIHLDEIVARMLGENLGSAVAPRYDIEEARQTLQFFAASTIPAPVNSFPNEVDGVRFRSNLTSLSATATDSELLRLLR